MPSPDALKYKAVVIGCRCCGNQRRFIVSEDEAGYVEAQFADESPVLVFNAYDLISLDKEDGGRFSQSLNRSDLNSLIIYPLSETEVAVIRAHQGRPAHRSGAARPISKANQSVALGSLLSGVKIK